MQTNIYKESQTETHDTDGTQQTQSTRTQVHICTDTHTHIHTHTYTQENKHQIIRNPCPESLFPFLSKASKLNLVEKTQAICTEGNA